jgi:hypothetical protein
MHIYIYNIHITIILHIRNIIPCRLLHVVEARSHGSHAFLQVYFHYPAGSSPLRPSDVKKAQERRSVAPKPKGLVFNTLTDGLETLDEVHGMGRAPGIGPKHFGGSNPSNHMTQSLERILTVLLWRIEDQSFGWFGLFMAQVRCIS